MYMHTDFCSLPNFQGASYFHYSSDFLSCNDTNHFRNVWTCKHFQNGLGGVDYIIN